MLSMNDLKPKHVLLTGVSPATARLGFALTELLVVLGIIAVVITLLLPVLTKVRESARKSVCSSNLRQLGNAFSIYASTNKGIVPRGNDESRDDAPPWTALIARPLGVRGVFTWDDLARLAPLHCPSHPAVDPTPVSHFVINAFIFDTPGFPIAGLTKISSMKRSSDLPWLLETPPKFGRMSFVPFDDIFEERARFVHKPEHLVGGTRSRLGLANHGRGVSNVLFMDGHVNPENNAQLSLETFDANPR